MEEDRILQHESYTKTPGGDILPPLHLLAEDTGQYTEYKIWGTPIEGLLVWERKFYEDERGGYQEDWRSKEISEALRREIVLKQVSTSVNIPTGVLRGIHAEPIDKIVTPKLGIFYIAIVDLRRESDTFGQYVSFTIDQRDLRKPRKSIVVSKGLGNSFETIGGEGETGLYLYEYAISEGFVTPEGKRSLRFDDPYVKDAVTGEMGVDWPIKPTIMSEVDKSKNPSLRELFPERFK